MGATVVAPASQGKSYWVVQECITPLVTSEQTGGAFELFTVDAQPNGGPPPHIHRREDELFYVIDGTFDFAFKDHVVRAARGACVFLPRDVLHTYKNVGERAGRLLVASMPGNFTRFVADAGEACSERTSPPAVGPATFEKLAAACLKHAIEMYPDWKPTAKPPAAGKPRELWVIGQHVKLLLTGNDTNDSFSVVEVTSMPGEFVPPHSHHREDEVFYVLEGTFEFDLQGRKVSAPAGTLIHVPKKTMHGFGNVSKAPAKLIDYHTPGGFEKFFEAAGTECLDVKLGPPRGAPDMERLIQIFLAHGMELPPR
jgi:mannose-6-phosphate isomerase-like protein (cupin superfamily)